MSSNQHKDDYRMSDRAKRLAGLSVSRPMTRGKLRQQHRDTVDLLRRAEFFAGMSEHELESLDGLVREFRFPDRWAVIAQGTRIENCFVVLEGGATEYEGGAAIRHIGVGSVIGLADAASNRTARSTIVSDGGLRGLAIDADSLIRLLNAAPRPVVERATTWAGVRATEVFARRA